MWRGRRLKGAVEAFLGTYVSRNSGYKGYSLFGQLCPDNPELDIDLLGRNKRDERGAREVARWIAVCAFANQREMVGLSWDAVRYAHLTIRTIPFPVERVVAGVRRRGNYVAFDCAAISDQDEMYRGTRTVFVAPHDPNTERRGTSVEDEFMRWSYRE